jgi:hypothetical protein
MMKRFCRHLPSSLAQRSAWGPCLIATGLLMLLMDTGFPLLPVVTAMAVIALGATIAAIARLDGSPYASPALAAHLFVYASLYLLFVGAVCHAAMAGGRGGLSLLQAGDLLISAAVMMLVVRTFLAALTRPTR